MKVSGGTPGYTFAFSLPSPCSGCLPATCYSVSGTYNLRINRNKNNCKSTGTFSVTVTVTDSSSPAQSLPPLTVSVSKPENSDTRRSTAFEIIFTIMNRFILAERLKRFEVVQLHRTNFGCNSQTSRDTVFSVSYRDCGIASASRMNRVHE